MREVCSFIIKESSSQTANNILLLFVTILFQSGVFTGNIGLLTKQTYIGDLLMLCVILLSFFWLIAEYFSF